MRRDYQREFERVGVDSGRELAEDELMCLKPAYLITVGELEEQASSAVELI